MRFWVARASMSRSTASAWISAHAHLSHALLKGPSMGRREHDIRANGPLSGWQGYDDMYFFIWRSPCIRMP